MNPQPAITRAAALIADPARAAKLLLLVDGRAHQAGELAYGAGVSHGGSEIQIAPPNVNYADPLLRRGMINHH